MTSDPALTRAATAGIVLRPSPSTPRARRQLVQGAVFCAAIGAAIIAVSTAGAFPAGWLFLGLCIVWYVGLPWLYFRNATLFVRQGHIGRTDWLGRTRTAPVSSVAAIRLIRTGRSTRKLVIEDASGSVRFWVYPTAWRETDIAALRRAAGLDDRPTPGGRAG